MEADPVPGVRNFRDAGGVGALRRGVLYRSGALHELSPAGARSLERLGVRTVVDLRSVPEMADRPDVRDGLGAGHVRAPVFAERRWPSDQLELYPFMAEHAGRSVVAVVRCLLAPGPPVLVHCASGKDRTGVVVAVLQTLLGASEAEVTADFLRSNAGLGLTADSASSTAAGHGGLPVSATLIRRAMLWIRSIHGSVPAYLLRHGAEQSELTALRASVA